MTESDLQPNYRSYIHHQPSMWTRVNVTLLFTSLLAGGGAILTSIEWNIPGKNADHKLFALLGLIAFVIFSIVSLNMLTNLIRKYAFPHLGVGRTATIRFTIQTFGYILIVLETLSLINVPIQTLLLGSAVTGIILGVAAQQALANFFASIILLVARPFQIGQRTVIKAGSFGEYTGVIIDMGLIHTRILQDNGTVALLPNATVLSSAAIMPIQSTDGQTQKKKTS